MTGKKLARGTRIPSDEERDHLDTLFDNLYDSLLDSSKALDATAAEVVTVVINLLAHLSDQVDLSTDEVVAVLDHFRGQGELPDSALNVFTSSDPKEMN
jgi:hypothetical protein